MAEAMAATRTPGAAGIAVCAWSAANGARVLA
jgi:hypothetical protein